MENRAKTTHFNRDGRRRGRIVICWYLMILSGVVMLAPSAAMAFSSIVAFGDSLTDNGAADGFGITTYSNGPVWVQYLADSSHFNVPLLDLAYVGATTGTDNPSEGGINAIYANTGVLSQVNDYLALTGTQIASDTLITLWAGANDLFQSRSYTKAAANIGTAIQELEGAGAQNFLVLNLPNIGATPYFTETLPAEASTATAWSEGFNASLSSELTTLEGQQPSDHFYSFDVFSLASAVTADPEAYGFSSLSDFYWADDPYSPGLHPSTAGHSLIANAIYDQMESVPEPNALLLAVVGGIGVALMRGRKRMRIAG